MGKKLKLKGEHGWNGLEESQVFTTRKWKS